MSLVARSPLIASSPIVFEAGTSCGSGRYVWSYVHRGVSTFLCNGTNPLATCSGNTIETRPEAFKANTTIVIRVEFFVFDERKVGLRQEEPLNPLAEISISFPEEEMYIFLFYGSADSALVLESSFENDNYYDNFEFMWSCLPLDPNSCPYCPSDSDIEGIVTYTSGTTPTYTIDFEEEFENDCEYEIGVEVVFSTGASINATREALILGDGAELPVIRFDDVSSSCSTERGNGEVYLTLGPVEGLGEGDRVVDYVWEQVRGGEVTCENSDTQNCGGDGNAFLFFPSSSVEPCVTYSWDVDIVIETSSDDLYTVKLPLCEVSFLAPPTNGTCYVVRDSDIDSECDVFPLSTAYIQCDGWVVECSGQSTSLTTQVFRVSESETSNLIALDSPTVSMENQFLVADIDMRIQVQVCNALVCTLTDFIDIVICEEDEEQRDDNIESVLGNTQDSLEENNLEDALQALLAVGDSLEECEDYFDEVIELTNAYVAASLASVDGNATNLGDTTVLMELLGTIGSKSCSAPIELFESLLLLCNSTSSADSSTYALDELLQAILSNAKTDDDKIQALDFAIQVNECVQASSLSDRCSDRLSTIYQGESFYFAQYIFTMQQFREEKVSIDIPNATVFFPRGFDRQIARDYTLSTGDKVIRFSCVAINMARTDGILSTGVAIDSAIVGMTAMVYVNGSAFTIELGHQGEPIQDVILRIYRQTERDDNKRSPEMIAKERAIRNDVVLQWGGLNSHNNKKKKEEHNYYYSKRLSLGDDCDETISCSYYEGQGFLSTNGCETVDVTDEWVDCACDHYSNFGLLFSNCNSEEWTIWRILTLAFLCSVWSVLLTLGGLVMFSAHFRILTGLETRAEKRSRVLGDAPNRKHVLDESTIRR